MTARTTDPAGLGRTAPERETALLPQAVAAIRRQRPLVHMITNLVSMNACAQSVKALGASTLFAHDAEEAVEATRAADVVVINIGTSVPGVGDTALRVAAACGEAGIPVVLDPVGVAATSYRRALVSALLETGAVSAVSGNAAETAFLAGIGATARGADALSTEVPAHEIAVAAAAATGAVIAVSGAVDYVADATRLVAIDNGHPMMGQVVGTGSARSAVLGALLAVAPHTPFQAVATGVCVFGVAGERAAQRSDGPGHFLAALHNALAALGDADVTDAARVRPAEGDPSTLARRETR